MILSRKVEDLLSLAKVAAGTLCNLGFVYHQNCSKSPKFLYKNKKILIQAVALNFGSPLEIERDGRKSTTRFGIFYTILGKQSWFLALPTAFWEINGGILLPTAFWEMDGGQFAPVAFIFLSTPPQIINFLAFWLQSWRKVGPGLWAAESPIPWLECYITYIKTLNHIKWSLLSVAAAAEPPSWGQTERDGRKLATSSSNFG